jgi:hypothetical protein
MAWNFLSLPKERCKMATMAMDDLLDALDKIELDRNLKISEEQEKIGLTMSVEEAKRRITEEFANGYHRK